MPSRRDPQPVTRRRRLPRTRAAWRDPRRARRRRGV